MKKYIINKLCATMLAGICMLNNTTIAISPDEYFERTHIAHESTYTLSDGTTYTKNIIFDDKLGFQNTYTFEFRDTEFSKLVFSAGESIYSRNSMEIIADNVDQTLGTVVGGVNADFFNMTTGVPESAFIKDGIIYTSDRSSYCFAKKSDGKYFFGIPDIRISMLRNETEYNIVFLNKELANNGIYMYTDKFSDETKIKTPTTEIVLYAYSEMLSPREIAEQYFAESNIPDDLYITIETPAYTSEEDSETLTETYLDVEEINSSDSEKELTGKSDVQENLTPANNESGNYNVNDETVNTFADENGEAQEATQSDEEFIEVFNELYRPILDIYAHDNGYTNIEGNYFIISKASPQIGKEQNAVVVKTRFNKEGSSLPIPEGAYVLSSDNSGFGYTLNNFENGETVVFKFTANEDFLDVTDAIGCGCMIVKDGKIVEDNSLTHYASQQPRTAIGLKADGSVVMFAVDGRKPGTSAGLKLSDLSAEMIRAGCVEAANFDGGGSTTVKVMSFDENKLVTGNLPSDTSERKISNAVLITNGAEKTGNAVYSYIETEKAFVMPNSVIPISWKTNFSDENHYGVDVSDVNKENFTYSAENGVLTENSYSPAGFVGTDNIVSYYNKDYSNVAAKIISVDNVDEIYLSSTQNSIYLHETLQLDVMSELYGWKVYDSLSEYSWGVSDDNGYIDENAVYHPEFTSECVELFAYFGDAVGKYCIDVKPYPFGDIEGHWSVGYCCTLYEENISVGEITTNGRMYFPERTYTRNEFCTMLSRIMGLTTAINKIETEVAADSLRHEDVPTETEADYTGNLESSVETEEVAETIYGKTLFEDDSLIPVWAYDSVSALYELGLLENFVHTNDTGMLFDGSEPVTRMEVMSVIGRLFENAPDDFELNFTDYDYTSVDSQYVKNSAHAGIIEGYEDGSLRPDGILTRAEGAAVFTRLKQTDVILN